MGQIGCISSNKNDNESIDRFSCSFSRSVTLTQARCESLSQIYKIGKYMKIARNDKMDEMWRSLLYNIEDFKEPPINQYNNKLGNEQQLNQPEYRIIANKEDYNMLILYASDKEQFKIYGFMGISQNIRWSYWKTVTLAEEIYQISQKSNWEKFSELFYTLSVDTNSIEKDITRTRIDTFFNHDIAISKLNMILKAIANEHPNVGYCQGMNYVAALLLMVSGGKEFECFIVFSHLISSPFYLLGQLFSEGLILLQVIEFIINQLMQEKLTKLYQHFQVKSIPNSFWLSKILLSGFVYIFKVQECVLFWDYILIRGTIKGFIELILAMLIVQEKELLLLDDLGIAEFFSFQEGKQAEPIIRQALQNDQIADDVIRKLAKKSKLKSILNRFGKKDFNSKFQQCK